MLSTDWTESEGKYSQAHGYFSCKTQSDNKNITGKLEMQNEQAPAYCESKSHSYQGILICLIHKQWIQHCSSGSPLLHEGFPAIAAAALY